MSVFSLVYGFSNAETDGWDSILTWGMLSVAGILLVAFVLWQRQAAHPLLPLAIVLDRNRAAAYISILIAGAGMFGIFLFVTYYLQTSLLNTLAATAATNYVAANLPATAAVAAQAAVESYAVAYSGAPDSSCSVALWRCSCFDVWVTASRWPTDF